LAGDVAFPYLRQHGASIYIHCRQPIGGERMPDCETSSDLLRPCFRELGGCPPSYDKQYYFLTALNLLNFITMASQELAVERRPSNRGDDGDEDRLAQFGYKQELKRDWGLAHNFGVSFSIIVSKPRLRVIAPYVPD
jgi:hypothetical protein